MRRFEPTCSFLTLLTGLLAFAAPLAAQTIASAAGQTFSVGDASTAAGSITITDAATPTITASHDIRIRIPSGLALAWDPTVTSVTITGSGASKVSTTVSYTTTNSIVVLAVSTNFAASNQIVVSGLKFTSFTAVSPATGLQLVTSGSATGATAATDLQTRTIVAPTLTEAASQVFTLDDPATVMSPATITDAATPVITASKDIRLRIPATLHLTWNTAVTTATLGGSARTKASTAVSYEDAGLTAVIPVLTNFAANDQLTVGGLQFTAFSAVSAAASLQLVIAGADGSTAATSSSTKSIVAPTIASAANQSFTIGDAATTISKITITDNATSPTITHADGIRVRIPATFGMTWNTALTTATISGTGAAKVSTTVSYEDGGQTLVIPVTSDFAAGLAIAVTGLEFANFSAYSPADNLQLVVAGSGGGTADEDARTIQVNQPPSISSAANQTFVTGSSSIAMSAITITDGISAPSITAAHDIRVRIPAGLALTWDPTVTTATIAGSGSTKVSTTVSYANSNADLVIAVSANFTSGQQIVVSGLKCTSFAAASPAANLELIVGGANGTVVGSDDKTKAIVAPSIASAAAQFFTVGQAAGAMSAVTVTDASTPGIVAATDLRIRIPAALAMTWNTALTTATISGSAASKVSHTVSYEDAGATLVIPVSTNFAANDQIVVSGLQFSNFSAAAAATGLQLVINGADGNTAATDANGKVVLPPTSLSSSTSPMFNVGMGAHAAPAFTVTADASGSITATNNLRIRIPPALGLAWNTAITTATIGGAEASKVAGTVTYESSGSVAVVNVTTTFAPGDQVTVSGLQFGNFTSVSSAALQLVVSGSATGTTTATDDKTTSVIAAYGISSAASSTYYVGESATAIPAITVTDSATTPTITSGHDIRLRIPSGLNLVWDNTATTVTASGNAAGRLVGTATYASGNAVVTINVATSFAAGDQVTISGLRFTTFSAPTAAANLQLVVSGSVSGPTVGTDDKTIAIASIAATVSPHAAAASQLPSNGTNYTSVFTVTNGGNGTDSYDLLTSRNPGNVLAAVRMTGTGVTQGSNPDSARAVNVAAAGSVAITVTYSAGSAAVGAVDTLIFAARSVLAPAIVDVGRLTFTLIRPNVVVARNVSPSGTQLVGTDLTYTSTVTNGGSASANSLVLVDSLSSAVQFKVGSVANSFPVSVVVSYSSNGGTTWTYTPASGACGAPSGYDRCVNRIRWTLGSSLGTTGPGNTGNAQYVARIR